MGLHLVINWSLNQIKLKFKPSNSKKEDEMRSQQSVYKLWMSGSNLITIPWTLNHNLPTELKEKSVKPVRLGTINECTWNFQGNPSEIIQFQSKWWAEQPWTHTDIHKIMLWIDKYFSKLNVFFFNRKTVSTSIYTLVLEISAVM